MQLIRAASSSSSSSSRSIGQAFGLPWKLPAASSAPRISTHHQHSSSSSSSTSSSSNRKTAATPSLMFTLPAAAAAENGSTSQLVSRGVAGSLCGSNSRRVLTLGAALTAATAGTVPWSRTGPAAAAGARAMAAAAAGGPGGAAAAGDTGVVVVYVTCPSPEVGESLAQQLVEGQLVACVNILPGVTSVYSWKGKIEKDSEVLLVMKTRQALLDTLTAKVKELHPYDEPEVIALPVVGGSSSYLKWVMDNTAGLA